MPTSAPLPTFFIPHGGGPCFFMEWTHPSPNPWTGLEAWLRALPEAVGVKPRAVLVISAHWESEAIALNVQAAPPLLFDYYNFPEHTYHLKYPAPGAPALARDVAGLLKEAGFDVVEERERGLDHGVFVPFLLIYPEADIPVLQMSLRRDLDPAAHLALGAALAPLRRAGVLIVGSGMSYHNMRQISFTNALAEGTETFDAWLTEAVCADPATRNAALAAWEKAPAARLAHPREEHLLPLMVAAGAAGDDIGQRTFSDRMLGWDVSAFQFGETVR